MSKPGKRTFAEGSTLSSSVKIEDVKIGNRSLDLLLSLSICDFAITAIIMAQTTAMLFALTSPHPSVSLEDFNKWYDSRHAPSRAACPGVHSVSRFRAEDDTSPEKAEALRKGGSLSPKIEPWTWMAMYELENESALQTDAYKKAREEDGDDESKWFDFLSRRVYKILSVKKRDDYADFASSGKTRYMTVVSIEPSESSGLSIQEFNDWYEQEHVPMLSKCPGWLRSSRWELSDARDPRMWDIPQKGIARFLALHEWEDADAVFSSAELKESVSTPWRKSTIGRINAETEERRLLKLWKQF